MGKVSDDGDFLSANLFRIHGECFELLALVECLGRGIVSVKSLHRLNLSRLIVVGVDGGGSDGGLLSLPRAHILSRLAQRAAEKALLAQTRTAVCRDCHADTDQTSCTDVRPRTPDRIVVNADVLRETCDDLIVKVPVVQEKTSIHPSC